MVHPPSAPVMLLALLLTISPPSPPAQPPESSPPESSQLRRLVLTNNYAVNWSPLSPVPSGEVSLFLGSSLRPRRRWRHDDVWTTALGYEVTVSGGAADGTIAYLSFPGPHGSIYHRHHLTAVGHGARDGRLYYAFGGGLLMYRTIPTALEADVKLGCVLGVRNNSRIKGVIGAQTRLVVVLSGAPLLQFGLFAGWALL